MGRSQASKQTGLTCIEKLRLLNEQEALVYFVLNGSNEFLSIGELKALLETYGLRGSLSCTPMVCTCKTSLTILDKIMERSGFLREAGILLGMDDPENPSLDFQLPDQLPAGWLHVSVMKKTVGERTVEKYVSLITKSTGINTSFSKGCEYRLIFSNGAAYLGVRTHRHRDGLPGLGQGFYKPFDRSIALNPRLAKALINLARVREGEVLADPFAGTGTIPVIASAFGISAIGVELDWSLVHGMEKNLRYYKANAIPVLGDSTQINLSGIDAVATDPPYGRGASTHGEDVASLYSDFIEKIPSWVGRGRYASFLAPLLLEDFVDDKISCTGLNLVGKYYDYVHSGLTRIVYVVKNA
ncbi:TRM11 family SAM-dependent methyltransferase [Thermosphaera sp.]